MDSSNQFGQIIIFSLNCSDKVTTRVLFVTLNNMRNLLSFLLVAFIIFGQFRSSINYSLKSKKIGIVRYNDIINGY